MKTKTIEMEAIGVIKTPWETPENMPIQPIGAKGIKGVVEVYPKFSKGLNGVDGFSHIMLIYQLHLVKNPQLEVIHLWIILLKVFLLRGRQNDQIKLEFR